MNRWHDRDSEVDSAPVVLHAETSVLRDAALRDVELAHDLDTGDNGRVMLFADRRHGLRQHAVDTELNDDRVVPSFNVNIRSSSLQCRENRGIDQADDRAGIASSRELVDGQRLFHTGVFVLPDDGEAFAGFFQNALRLLGFFENVVDLPQRCDLGHNALLQKEADLVDHHQLAGIGDSNGEATVRGLLQRDKLVAEHQVWRDLLEQIMVKLKISEVDKLATIPPRYVLCPLEVGDGISRGHDLSTIPATYKK